jgi:hypothetical protein
MVMYGIMSRAAVSWVTGKLYQVCEFWEDDTDVQVCCGVESVCVTDQSEDQFCVR